MAARRRSAAYTLRADEWGCWDAQRIEVEGQASLAPRDSACIIVFDYIHILDR